MTNDRDGTEFTAADAYISGQLQEAARTLAAHIDTHARLETIVQEASRKDDDGAVAASD